MRMQIILLFIHYDVIHRRLYYSVPKVIYNLIQRIFMLWGFFFQLLIPAKGNHFKKRIMH